MIALSHFVEGEEVPALKMPFNQILSKTRGQELSDLLYNITLRFFKL